MPVHTNTITFNSLMLHIEVDCIVSSMNFTIYFFHNQHAVLLSQTGIECFCLIHFMNFKIDINHLCMSFLYIIYVFTYITNLSLDVRNFLD